jgi:hypothetical protein
VSEFNATANENVSTLTMRVDGWPKLAIRPFFIEPEVRRLDRRARRQFFAPPTPSRLPIPVLLRDHGAGSLDPGGTVRPDGAGRDGDETSVMTSEVAS